MRTANTARKPTTERTAQPNAGNLVGYARVSTTYQNTDAQASRLKDAGCTIISH